MNWPLWFPTVSLSRQLSSTASLGTSVASTSEEVGWMAAMESRRASTWGTSRESSRSSRRSCAADRAAYSRRNWPRRPKSCPEKRNDGEADSSAMAEGRRVYGGGWS